MPLSKYYGGSGEKVMASMKKRYGKDKGERVFYATANKRGLDAGPSKKVKKEHGV
jgi:hypothetical protein